MDRITLDEIKGCYRKFKSNVYYQNSLCYLKEKIALFESDYVEFEHRLLDLTNAINNHDMAYFEALYSQIDYIVVPKPYLSNRNSAESIDNKKMFEKSIIVKEVNYHILCPVELNIVDTLCTLLLGQKINFNKELLKYCYANKFYRETYDENNEINFNNLNIFDHYFKQYKKWKNDAINISRHYYNRKIDSSIISLDISGFFYNIEANIFDILNKNSINNYSEFEIFIFNVVQKIFEFYTQLIKKTRKVSVDKCLPIGLTCSSVISNLYLNSIDHLISSKVKHYGRYVDDIIIVLDNCDFNKSFDFFSSLTDIFVKKDGFYSFKDYPNLIVKNDKCRIIKNFKNGSSNIFEKLLTEEYSISESNLFPSFNANIDELLKEVYKKEDFIKFREFNGNLINHSNISKTINSIITSFQGTNLRLKRDKNVINYCKDLLKNLSNVDLSALIFKWDKLVLLFHFVGRSNEVNRIFKKLEQIKYKFSLTSLDGNLYYANKKIKGILKNKLISSYDIFYHNAYYSYCSLVGVSKNEKDSKIIKLCEDYRNAVLFDLKSIKYPMLQYCTNLPNTSLVDISFEEYIDLVKNEFDLNKIYYSPSYLTVCEYLWVKQIVKIVQDQQIDLTSLYNDFYDKFEKIFGYKKEPIEFTYYEKQNHSSRRILNINFTNLAIEPVNKINKHSISIAIAGINLDNMNILDKKGMLNRFPLNPYVKAQVIDLLNDSYKNDFSENKKNLNPNNKNENQNKTANKEAVNFIVFPESFLPYEWVKLIDKFAKETQSVIVSGVRYVTYKGRAFNLVAVEVPYFDRSYHKQSLILLREKNHYPLYERNILHNSHFDAVDHLYPLYFTVTKDDVTFSPIICYEITDVYVRALLKNYVNYIFTVAYNKDVNYFHNIGMSTARDLTCFYIECNSSNYGSASYAPYRDEFLPISNSKGDSRNHMQIVSTNLQEIIDYNRLYFDCYAKYTDIPVINELNKKMKKLSAKTDKYR